MAVSCRSNSSGLGPEGRLKAAVIDRLFEGKHIDGDAVLVSELVVDRWNRRADVVLANGKLWGFEIKSDHDSLTRLTGQLDTFTRFFEKFVVVVAPRFEAKVRKFLPEGTGLWVEMPDGSLKERLRPKATSLPKEVSIRMMTVTELRRFLACNGFPGVAGASRAQLEHAAAFYTKAELALAAREAIKCRHRARHKSFERGREEFGTSEALKLLEGRYRKPAPEALAEVEPTNSIIPECPADHPAAVAVRSGYVLKRVTSISPRHTPPGQPLSD
jgi:hypothetical protein